MAAPRDRWTPEAHAQALGHGAGVAAMSEEAAYTMVQTMPGGETRELLRLTIRVSPFVGAGQVILLGPPLYPADVLCVSAEMVPHVVEAVALRTLAQLAAKRAAVAARVGR